jgi:hypothetical protein
MKGLRFSSFGTVLLFAAIFPVSAQAQFGKLIQSAKAVKTSLDSAKAVVDTTKTVISSGKAAVADATNGSLAVESAADTSKAKTGGGSKGAGGKASASGPSAATGAAAAATRSRSQPTTTAAVSKTGTPAGGASAGTGRTASASAPASAQLSITEPVYGQFARGAAVQRALLKANPKDQAGALAAALSASGLNNADYSVLRSRAGLYYAYAQSNTLANATGVISAPELAVLNAHKADVLQLMQP